MLPTLLGWLCILTAVTLPPLLWCLYGEGYLASTRREPAEVLIVEAWIDREGAEAAAAEFLHGTGSYRYVVAVGGKTGNVWTKQRWNYAEIAERQLRHAGIPTTAIIPVSTGDIESDRTYTSAVAVCQALAERGIRPKAVNVFTRGVHARRSRLVFSHAFGNDTKVGAVAWDPQGELARPWWRSTERTVDFFKETAGYLGEPLMNLRRRAASPTVD